MEDRVDRGPEGNSHGFSARGHTSAGTLSPAQSVTQQGVWLSQESMYRDRRRRLSDIRSSELEDYYAREGELPRMPREIPGFLSSAHRHSDEYWRELLGIDAPARGPCQFIVTDAFQTLVAMAILANAFLWDADSASVVPYHWRIKQLLLVFSLSEICLVLCRYLAGIAHRGCRVFVVDSAAVLCCVFAEWVVVPAVSSDDRVSDVRTVARLVWLVRFVRVINMVPALHELARAVGDAVQGLVWVLVFMVLLLYAIAIPCTRLIGHGEMDLSHACADVRSMFADVFTSMFYLFETMTQWTLSPLFPLFDRAASVKLGFVLFYIYAGLVVLAVLSGVVSFNMITLRERSNLEEEEKEEERRARARDVILEIFEGADADGSGEISAEEFRSMLKSGDVLRRLQQHTNVKARDLQDLWTWIDDDGSGSVSLEELMRGFAWLNERFTPKTLLRLQKKIGRELTLWQRRAEALVAARFEGFVWRVRTPLRKLDVVTEQIQALEDHVAGFLGGARACAEPQGRASRLDACSSLPGFGPDASMPQRGAAPQGRRERAPRQVIAEPTPEGPVPSLALPGQRELRMLREIEGKVSSQIERALERLERFAPRGGVPEGRGSAVMPAPPAGASPSPLGPSPRAPP